MITFFLPSSISSIFIFSVWSGVRRERAPFLEFLLASVVDRHLIECGVVTVGPNGAVRGVGVRT